MRRDERRAFSRYTKPTTIARIGPHAAIVPNH
jgi:hypothetical protein